MAAAKHIQSLEVNLSELAKRPDSEIAETVRELQQILAEVRELLR